MTVIRNAPGLGLDPPAGPSLRVVCVNDVYTLENLPRLRSLVAHHRAERPADRLLVTLAGDFVAPSILASLDKGVGMVDCLNAVPITHVTFGNHEDDVGTGELRKRVLEFRGTWLNTNMPAFTPALPAHQIVEVARPGGRTVRVGLLGLLAHQADLYQPGAFGGAPIAPVNETAVRASQLLQDAGCACVIPLTHQDLADDRALARLQRAPRFPIIVAGHDHEVVLEEIDGTWLIKAGANATNAVVVDLVWPAEAPPAGTPDLPVVTVRLEAVAPYPEDAALRARVDGHMKSVHALDGATLVRLAPGEVLSSVGMKVRQTSLGTLLCSRIRDTLGADGCLINSGGVRGERAYEDRFTYANLKSALPYANEMAVVSLPGRVIRDAVACSRAATRDGSSGFLQVDDGMLVGPGDGVTDIGGRPIALDREYRIAIVLGLLGGMNSIAPLLSYAHAHPERIPPADSGREIKIILVEAFALELWQQLGSFEDIDADRDGVITADELKDAITRATAEAPAQLVVDDMIRVLDTDGDRTITREEARALVRQFQKRGSNQAAGRIAAQSAHGEDGR